MSTDSVPTGVVADQAPGPDDSGTEPGSVPAGVLLASATVGLVALAFPPVGWWPAIFVAFVPMVVAQHRVMPSRWSGLAVGVAIGAMFAYHLSPGLADGNVSPAVHTWPLVVALVVAALAWRSRSFQERTGYRWFVVSAPVAWVALDFLRASGTEVMAATFGYPGYALYEHPILIQPISVFGIHGLELLILAFNWAVAGLVIGGIDRRRPPTESKGRAVNMNRAASRRRFGLVLGVFAVWVGLGAAMMDSAPASVRVAAVQTGVERGPGGWEERYRRDVEQTREAAARGAELVVWNEAGLQLDATVDRTDELRDLSVETGAHLAVGFQFVDGAQRRHNEVLLMTPEGSIAGVYGKDHPGTFAGDYSDTGGTYPVYETELGSLATIICYDLDFTDTARFMARGGAQVVAAPSADVPAIAETHYTHLVFRAVENRLSMVKADNEFDSAIIDPWGRILERAVSRRGGLQATLVADVPLGSGDSPWVRFGDWFGWLAVGVTVAFAGWGALLRRRSA